MVGDAARAPVTDVASFATEPVSCHKARKKPRTTHHGDREMWRKPRRSARHDDSFAGVFDASVGMVACPPFPAPTHLKEMVRREDVASRLIRACIEAINATQPPLGPADVPSPCKNTTSNVSCSKRRLSMPMSRFLFFGTQ